MAHTHDSLCLTVVVFLVRDGKVLLVNHPKYSAWLPVGGHIDPGEDTDQALFRELEEEAGLTKADVHIFGQPPEIPGGYKTALHTPAFIDRHQVSDRVHVAIVYFGKILGDVKERLSAEHTEMKWFSKEDLERGEGLQRDIIFYSIEALKKSEE